MEKKTSKRDFRDGAQLPNSFTKETDKIPYYMHHKTYSIFSGIIEHQRFMVDEKLITKIIKLL